MVAESRQRKLSIVHTVYRNDISIACIIYYGPRHVHMVMPVIVAFRALLSFLEITNFTRAATATAT